MSAIWAAILDMPRRIHSVLADPIRRRNLCWRIVEGYVGGLALVGLFLLNTARTVHLPVLELALEAAKDWETWMFPLVVPAAEFLVYEFLLEPLGLAGHYWERGPRDGEAFRHW